MTADSTLDVLGGDSGLDDVRRRVRTAAEVAGRHADEVDQDARIPHEGIDAMRGGQLMSLGASTDAGGAGLGLAQLALVAEALSAGCSAVGMIWAMHQTQVACLAAHARSDFAVDYLRRVCAEQLLLASATSEVGVGGDIRRSNAALTASDGQFAMDKLAPAVSYGFVADAILVSLRRSPEAVPNDQVLALVPTGGMDIERLSAWDSLGMRGTCTVGLRLRATLAPGQVLDDPFGTIVSRTMVPHSHILWSACWIGIAGAALRRARSAVRTRQRAAPNEHDPALLKLAHADARLSMVRAAVLQAAHAVDTARNEGWCGDWREALQLNSLKVEASETAVDTALAALRLCGFAGYARAGEGSVGRQLRDCLSAPLMISNDRLLTTNGGLLVSRKE